MPQLRAQFVLFDGSDPLHVIAPCEALVAHSDLLDGALAVERMPRGRVAGERRHA